MSETGGDGEIFPRRVRWMPLFVAPVFIVLIGLGAWQVDRLSWKEQLLTDIQVRLSEPAVKLSDFGSGDSVESWNYRRGTATGTLLHQKSVILLARTYKKHAGAHVLTPLILSDRKAILVNRGWVPQGYAAPGVLSEAPVAIKGIIRIPRNQGLFTPNNDPLSGQWYWIDLVALSLATGLDFFPVILEMALGSDPAALPIGGQTLVDFPNNHLQYAVTWFGLATVLMVSFGVYYGRYLRERRGRSGW